MEKSKKKITILFLAVALILTLIGCKGTEVFEEKPEKPSPITEVQEGTKEVKTEIVEPEAKEPVLEEVLGNGTHFVKVGDLVYFREYDEEALECSALWGEIHSQIPEEGKRYIKSFNVMSGDVQTAFEDDGYGPLSYYNGLFYLRNADGYYTICEDGSNKKPLELEGEGAILEKIIGKYLFYSYVGGEVTELKCLNLDTAEITTVCPIPEDAERGWATICQIELLNEDVYVGISYIAGSGNFHQGGDIYHASVLGDKEPEKIREMASFEEGEEYIYVSEDGKYDFGNRAPGSAYMEDNDIWVCEKDGSRRCFYKDFIKGRMGLISDSAEQLSYLDGSVYLIRNAMRYTKEDDIGWREAYRVFRSSDIRITDNSVVNEFNIVKGKPETIPANVYYIHETGPNGETQVIYQPLVIVHMNERELCEKLGVDPDNPDEFLENMHIADPYFGEGFIGILDDNLSAEMVDFESPNLFKTGGKDEFVSYMLEDPYDMYTMLSLTNLQHDEWMDYYVFPELDYSDPNAPIYKGILAYITFNEDGTAIVGVEEIYIP